MAPWAAIPMVTQRGVANSGHASEARLVNLYAAPQPPGSPEPFHLHPSPGFSSWNTTGSGLIRGMCVFEGYLWVVKGTSLYYINSAASATLAGTVSGTALCRMIDAVTHVVIVDGTNAYAATTAGVTSCSRANFSDVSYSDGYTIYTETSTQSVYVSSLDDPTTIDALDFTTADALGGDIVGCAVNHRELWVFKENSIETYYNAGGSGFPFARTSPGVIEVGCLAKGTITKYRDRLFWLGDNGRAYTAQGYQPEDITTEWVSTQWSFTYGSVLPTAVGFPYEYDGRSFYAVSLPVAGITTNIYVYDIGSGLWHERTPNNGDGLGNPYHVAGCMFLRSAFFGINNTNSSDGHVSLCASSYGASPTMTEDTKTVNRIAVLPPLDGGGVRAFMGGLRVNGRFEAAVTTQLDWSDNGGSTYPVAMTSTDTSRVAFMRLGSFFRRNLRLYFVTAGRFSVTGVEAMLSRGAA